MKRKQKLVILVGSFSLLTYFGYIKLGSTESVNSGLTGEKRSNAIVHEQPKQNGKASNLEDEFPNQQADVIGESDQQANTIVSTYVVWQELAASIKALRVDTTKEKQLILMLREEANPAVYDEIRKLLQLNPSGTSDRTQEYLLSLLAAINTSESVTVFLEALQMLSNPSSNTVYVAKKSVQKVSQDARYTMLLRESFVELQEDSLYLSDIAQGLAKNASANDFEFLIDIAQTDDSKSKVALSSLQYLNNERLVPNLQQVIASNAVGSELVDASLNSLANMGQYEAGVALIKWSANQNASDLAYVRQLISQAESRSPSMSRAIEKTLHKQMFVSSEVKEVIEQIYRSSDR
ncbi:hypothetical protein [Vibrio hyugaensis]|uniref:hypothetical protein n=1 Tax=Vibrio hyugaensis TaxID=1534743 RepID=UPI000CE4C455|nr:hypothetical protein [Vibrio hyugaensis]